MDNLFYGISFMLVVLLFMDLKDVGLTMIIIIGFGAVIFNILSRFAGVLASLLTVKHGPLSMKRLNFITFLPGLDLKKDFVLR